MAEELIASCGTQLHIFFLTGVFILYWSLPLGALMGRIRFWKLSGSRNDAYGW